jgi:predicted kinase
MSKLIIMSGLPASGKSTKAKEIMDASGNTVRINKDLLRTMLHFDKFDYNNEEATRLAAQTLARLFLSKGKTVIIDDTNLNEKTMQSWKSLAKDAGSRIQYEDMDTSLNECLLRDMKREKPVGDTVIVGMALSSGKYPKPDLPVVLCDIDGTLAKKKPPKKKRTTATIPAGIPSWMY